MADKLLLNGKVQHYHKAFLPSLIHYRHKTGGSHYSVTLLVDLFLQGKKILFFTAYPMARENFLNQVGNKKSAVSVVSNTTALKKGPSKQAIILKSGDSNLFLKALKYLNDINERIILVKNCEFFSKTVIISALKFNNLVLSGDIDQSTAKKEILHKEYNSQVFFSKPKFYTKIKFAQLKKYQGYFWSRNKRGLAGVRFI